MTVAIYSYSVFIDRTGENECFIRCLHRPLRMKLLGKRIGTSLECVAIVGGNVTLQDDVGMIGELEAGIALVSRYRSILLLEEARILNYVAEVRIIVFLHGRHLYLGLEIRHRCLLLFRNLMVIVDDEVCHHQQDNCYQKNLLHIFASFVF